MTVDELVSLCEAVFDSTDLKTIRNGNDYFGVNMNEWDDEQFLLAIRFMCGERPSVSQPYSDIPSEPRPPRRERRLIELDEDEAARRLAALEELDEETPAGPVDLGDGVTLGL